MINCGSISERLQLVLVQRKTKCRRLLFQESCSNAYRLEINELKFHLYNFVHPIYNESSYFYVEQISTGASRVYTRLVEHMSDILWGIDKFA